MSRKIIRNLTTATLVFFLTAVFAAGCFLRRQSSYEWLMQTIENNYYFGFEGKDEDLTEVPFDEIVNRYLDRYSEYFTAEEYAQTIANNSGSKSGIGISYSFVDGKGIFINTVVGNSPAYKSGLRAGEWLVSGGLGGEVKTFESSADFQNTINGAADGEQISLTAKDGSVYGVAKAEYTASYTTLYTNSSQWYFSDAATGGLATREKLTYEMDFLPDGFGYINISQFYGTAAKEFGVLVEKFNAANCTSMIIDLRSDGGGYVDVMQEIAGAFTDGQKKPAMIARDKRGNSEIYNCKPLAAKQRVAKDTAVYVLANSGTASASEALIGALVCYGYLDYGNIYLSDYGEEYINWLTETEQEIKTAQTYGKGIMQSTFVKRDTGEALKLTTAQIYWPDGKTCIHDRGLRVEDGCKTVAADWVMEKGDPELRAAVEKIKSSLK